MKRILPYIALLLLFLSLSCREEVVIPVEIDVTFRIKDDNHTSPLYVNVDNRTKNADRYSWTFEGGIPAASTAQYPSVIRFDEPGEHRITLRAWNDGDTREQTFTIRVDSAVVAAFTPEVIVNNHAPAQYRFINNSAGGTSYSWTFEGGDIPSFEGQHPPMITYNDEGTYTVSLTIQNGSATFNCIRQITVTPSLEADFDIVPSFEDEDYEAPLRATFDARLQGVESLEWKTQGGVLTSRDTPESGVFFANPGLYTITLEASNGKEIRTVSKNIEVKPNRNLRTHAGIALGINTAQDIIGSCYSTKLRRVVKQSEIKDTDPSLIDIVYEGLNKDFVLNKFISPDSTGLQSTMTIIPNAVHTRFINKQEDGNVLITPGQFDAMTDDRLLQPIRFNLLNYGWAPFEASPLPRVVLFETYDGRKGAILVKELVSLEAHNSHLLIDIKIQKND